MEHLIQGFDMKKFDHYILGGFLITNEGIVKLTFRWKHSDELISFLLSCLHIYIFLCWKKKMEIHESEYVDIFKKQYIFKCPGCKNLFQIFEIEAFKIYRGFCETCKKFYKVTTSEKVLEIDFSNMKIN